LDTTAFATCLDSGRYKDEAQKDMADGSASGVNGTPGFWVLGPDGQAKSINGAQPFSAFKETIDAMIP
jgi:predicted DsbA family dithiol-disulfide isomerase